MTNTSNKLLSFMSAKFKNILIEIKPSKVIKGEVGVFTVKDIKEGQIVFPSQDYEEEFITDEQMEKLDPLFQENIKKFGAGRPGGYFFEAGIDFNELPISYYCNHSCNGNMGFDEQGEFISLRNIKKGEELTYDYGLVEANPHFKFLCRCGSKYCRKVITGNDWKNPEFQKKHKDHIYPDLRIK